MPQVIIPKPIYPSQLYSQNLFHLSLQNSDINNLPPKNFLSYPKKINGAFKLYKQKKYRNRDSQNTLNNQTLQICQPIERRAYKLISKEVPNQSINVLASFTVQIDSILDYFDPNTAPTFVEQENKECYLKMYKQKLNQSIEKKQIQNQQRILVQKKIMKETEPQELQNQFTMVPEQGKPGDPFIIMKKAKIIKKGKSIKNIENLSTKTKKITKKKDKFTNSKFSQIQALQRTQIIQESFEKQKQQKRQKQSNNFMRYQCSFVKEQRTEWKQNNHNDKEIDRQIIKEIYDKFSGPSFILHLQSESQSNIRRCDFESYGQKEALPLIK